MSTTHAHARRLSVVAIAACGLVGLSACSSGSSADSSSSASMTTSSTLPTISSTSSAPSASRSVLASSSAASASSTSGKPISSRATASKTTKAAAKPDPVAACKTANTKSNQAISQWNSAVNSQSKSKLDSAAHNFRTVADSLRKLPAKADQKGFTSRVKAVANDLDQMAENRSAGKSVDPTTYNKDSETLRTYCQRVLTSQ